MPQTSPPQLIVTQGEPTGVGPELILQVAAQGLLGPRDRIIGDPAHFEALSNTLEPPWAAAGWARIRDVIEGEPGLCAVAALERGVDQVLAAPGRALVTAPIDKSICMAQGFAYPGHTEYLAHRAGDCDVAMLMAGPTLRVVLATVHIPLAQVPQQLTSDGIVRVGQLLADALRRRFGIDRPRIAVLGLNPHAGERGVLGREDIEVVAPAVAALQRTNPGAGFEGPLPADTALHAHAQGRYDGVVAMYHDQGLGPFKLIHFHDGVNMTLGLPFVRTSPDHGTAMDLVGTGTADPSSLRAAIRMARGEGL